MTRQALVGDIGGTNARFALVDYDSEHQRVGIDLDGIATLQCADFDNVDEAIRQYLKEHASSPVSYASLAFACPVNKPDIVMTNNHWRFNKEQMRAELGFKRLAIVNDFTAMALGVSVLQSQVGAAGEAELTGKLRDSHAMLCPVGIGAGETVGGVNHQSSAPKLVIGPGTGLGLSALIGINNSWMPLATEGGHTSFSPTDDREMAMLNILMRKYGRVSVERLLSGSGLVNIYACHAEIAGEAQRYHSPADITAAALGIERTPNPIAQSALHHFCELLGRVAGDAVLTIGAFGGVYICGGIVPRILDFFLSSDFRPAFEDKGRMSHLLKATPVYVVTDAHAGLRGAAAALSNPFIRSDMACDRTIPQ